jgi:hypothetical protein
MLTIDKKKIEGSDENIVSKIFFQKSGETLIESGKR